MIRLEKSFREYLKAMSVMTSNGSGNIPDKVLVVNDCPHEIDSQQQQCDAFCVQFISLEFIQFIIDDEHSGLPLQFKSMHKNHQKQGIIFLVSTVILLKSSTLLSIASRISSIAPGCSQEAARTALQIRVLYDKTALIPYFDEIGQFRIQRLRSLSLGEINLRIGHNRIFVRCYFLLQQFSIGIFDGVHTDDCVADIHQSHDGYSQKSH